MSWTNAQIKDSLKRIEEKQDQILAILTVSKEPDQAQGVMSEMQIRMAKARAARGKNI